MEEAEWTRRRVVWCALSDVFLDTETRWFFPSIAATLAASGYSVETLDRIWRYEVVPEFRWNLFGVAGEWAALPIDEASLRRRARRKITWWIRAWAWCPHEVADQWRALLMLRAHLVAFPAPERGSVVAAWSAFANAYLVLDPTAPLDPVPADAVTAAALTSACAQPALVAFLKVYEALLIGPERTTAAARAHRVQALLHNRT